MRTCGETGLFFWPIVYGRRGRQIVKPTLSICHISNHEVGRLLVWIAGTGRPYRLIDRTLFPMDGLRGGRPTVQSVCVECGTPGDLDTLAGFLDTIPPRLFFDLGAFGPEQVRSILRQLRGFNFSHFPDMNGPGRDGLSVADDPRLDTLLTLIALADP